MTRRKWNPWIKQAGRGKVGLDRNSQPARPLQLIPRPGTGPVFKVPVLSPFCDQKRRLSIPSAPSAVSLTFVPPPRPRSYPLSSTAHTIPAPPIPRSLGTDGHEQNVIAELARQSDDDESALLLGLRQDVLDHVQYLDSFSYNNVFVGEERRILGTKIDFDTPRMGKLHAKVHAV